MLVLSRRINEKLTIDLSRIVALMRSNPSKAIEVLNTPIEIKVCDVQSGPRVRIGIDAAEQVSIYRNELGRMQTK
jgi:sRNA-binding carbon storage regulator CsrA